MPYFRVPEGCTLEEERFIESANSGDSETFGPLLQKFADANSYDLKRFAKISYFAFQLAARRGHTDIIHCFGLLPSTCEKAVEALMKVWAIQGAELTSSPLHFAVREDHVDAVDAVLNFLVDKNRTCESLAHYSYREWSSYFGGPLKWATRWGHASTVCLVVAHFLIVDSDVLLLFHMAAQHSRVDVLQILLEEYFRNYMVENKLNNHSSDGLTALHIAAQFGSYPAVEFLLKQSEIQVKARSNPEGFTPLHMAANSGHVEVVNLLLQKPNRGTSEEAACIDLELLRARDCIGRTALHYAVRQGHELVVQKLLSCTSQANLASIADYDGFLPLHLAARAGQIGLIRQLRSFHADAISCKAQHATHMKERVEMEYMIEREKNSYHGERWGYPRPRLVDSFFWKTKGFTPLHFAIMYGHTEADLRELLEHTVPDPSCKIDEDHAGSAEAASFCKSKVDEEAKAMDELRHAWQTGTRPPLKVHIVQMLEADTEIGSVRKYWLSRAVRTGDLDLFRRLLVLFKEFHAKDEKSTEYDCWALHYEAVRQAFQQLAFTYNDCSDESIIRVLIAELLLLLPAINADEVVTVLLKALENMSFEAAKEILLQVPQAGLQENGLARGVERWIVKTEKWQLEKGESFLMALVTREGLAGAPSLLRQMLTRAQAAEMEDLVGVIMDRPELKRSPYEDRQVYLDCANAILVGAALIVGIAVQGWLQPPLGYSYAYEEEQYVEVHKPLMRVFWKCNNGAFFLAVGALIAGAKGAVPVARETDILKSVEKVKRAVAVASTFLGGALVCLVVAFAAAGFVVLPPDGSDFRMMRDGVIWGAMPCGLAFLWFCWNVLPLLLYLLQHLNDLVCQTFKVLKDLVCRTFTVLSGQSPEDLADIFQDYGRHIGTR